VRLGQDQVVCRVGRLVVARVGQMRGRFKGDRLGRDEPVAGGEQLAGD
jgi:hypothetical protein